jgi:hypothetical protein
MPVCRLFGFASTHRVRSPIGPDQFAGNRTGYGPFPLPDRCGGDPDVALCLPVVLRGPQRQFRDFST